MTELWRAVPDPWRIIFLCLCSAILIDLATKPIGLLVLFRSGAGEKARNRWILCILFIPFLGGLVYLVRTAVVMRARRSRNTAAQQKL